MAKTEEQQTRTVVAVVATTCDLCGKKAPRAEEWTNKPYHYLRICIELVEGEAYPEYSTQRRQEFDSCPECWETKIVPLFPNPPRIVERDD